MKSSFNNAMKSIFTYWRGGWLDKLLGVCKAGSFLLLYDRQKMLFSFFSCFSFLSNEKIYLAKKWGAKVSNIVKVTTKQVKQF